MKLTLFFLTIATLAMCIAQGNKKSEQERYREELFQTDRAFNDSCQVSGLPRAFIQFAADDVVLMRQGRFPIVGKDSLRANYLRMKGKPDLRWHPVKADAAQSGDLGYTFGEWESTDKTADGRDTLLHGVYISVWKKQVDGSWKYVFDGGNLTPPPLENPKGK